MTMPGVDDQIHVWMSTVRAGGGPLVDSIVHYATPLNVAAVAGLILIAVLAPVLLERLPSRAYAALGIAGVALVAAGPFAAPPGDTMGRHRNAVTALIESARERVPRQEDSADWRRSPFAAPPGEDLTRYRGTAAGRNVVLIVLESTAARALRPYGAADDPMPHLSAFAKEAVLFEHAYAVYPESIKGLFATLCSRAPAFDVSAEAHAASACAPLPQVLRDAGYRTAIFHSGRFAYLGMRELVDRVRFETAEDAGDIGGEIQSSFGVGEPAAVARMLAWIDALPPDEPFFLSYLPAAGHHPYLSPGGGPFDADTDPGAYRNALYDGDRALGVLFDGLRARGLTDRTLFVVMGDHGEAFGEHAGNFGHSLFIHEENVRVPYLIAMPGGPLEPARVARVVSVVDTAPTVLDLLGLPASPLHEGGSMLAPSPRLALFFTDYALGWLGLRDGCWKFQHELESQRSRLFDVCRDPGERHDVASDHVERVRAYRQRVVAWSSAQRAAIEK